MLERFKNFILECIRVFKITRKPGLGEFKAIVKVSSIGILLIGLIGFIIQIVWQLYS